MGIATIKCFENSCTAEDSLDSYDYSIEVWVINLEYSGWVISEEAERELNQASGHGPDQEAYGQCPDHATKAGD